LGNLQGLERFLPIDVQRRRASLERLKVVEAATSFVTVCNDVSNGLAVLPP
jgi:hypothetical protein